MVASNSQGRTGRGYYALALLPWALTFIAFVWIVVGSVRHMTANLTRVIFPGETAVQLTHVGPQIVFYEYESHMGNRAFHTSDDLKEMHCTLVNSITGVKIPLRTPKAHTTYTDTGHYSGYSVLEFRLESPGAYDFTCNYTQGKEGEQVVFAVGPDNTGAFFIFVLLGIFVVLLGLGAGALAVALVYRKRNLPQNSSAPGSSSRGAASSSLPSSD